MRATILLIEDDPGIVSALEKVLRDEDYEVTSVSRGDQGLAEAQSRSWDLVITDLRLPGLSGMDLIARLHATRPKLPIIMITAHGTTETAIEATKLGACDYLVKPFEADELLDLTSSAVANSRRMSETVDLGDGGTSGHAIVGNSRVMQSIYKEIGRVAATPLTVLIRGGTGTGKELIARAIYQHSDRADKSFIAVNCAAIPETLLESELFGHERGSFTGAQTRRIGRFEQAEGGTIMLDEIGDLSLNTQAKLLRVLQEKCFQRLGGDELLTADVRVLAATHRDLETAIQEKEFREDLFYRLSVVTITLPPLNERTEDIPDLVRFFMKRYARDLGIGAPSIESEAMGWLQTQDWPGSIRELENVVRRAMLLSRTFGISLQHVQQARTAVRDRSSNGSSQTHAAYISELLSRVQRGEEPGGAFAKLIADLEPELYRQAIQLARGNQAKAARWLGVTRLKMREKLTQLGLHSPKPLPQSDDQQL